MATTSRFGLHYQALTDAPDGAALGGLLAGDVDALLSKFTPVADAAARIALGGTGIPAGFGVLQQDDNTVWMWSGSTWVEVTGSTGGGGGGGGGGSGSGFIDGQWRASSNQTLSNSTDTVLGFATTETASTAVTRATSGPGHKFTLGSTGIWAVTATVRFISGAAGARFIELRNSAQNTRYASSGVTVGSGAATLNFSVTRQFTVGQELVVIAAQTSGGTLATQYQGTSITDGFVRLNITYLG
jgi:hypothetical protein